MPKKVKIDKTGGSKETIIDIGLLEFAREHYYRYGISVIEDRAIPDFRDGQIPVTRRLLYSMYEMHLSSTTKHVKSARVVGDTLGKFHPHGDSSCYGALVGMTQPNSTIPLANGEGNWGSMTDPSFAAMRYTEVRLSKVSDAVIFNKFYTPIMESELVPNYDGSLNEPLLLPALLPIVLLNGKLGIAPGATAYIPTCTYDSITKVLKGIYGGQEIDSKYLYKNLRFTSVSGGVEGQPEDQEAKDKRVSLFKGTSGAVTLESTHNYDPKTRTLTVTAFANHWSVEKLLEKLVDLEMVAEARNDSTKNDKYAVVTVILSRKVTPKMEKAVIKHIVNKLLTTRENYVLNFTERYVDETGQGQARMKPMSLTTFFKEWVKWRTELERKACQYWIGEDDKQIRRLEVLMMACDNLDFIFKLLKSKVSRKEMDEQIAKKMKLTLDEAHMITEMKVYQLRALERDDMEKRKKETEKHRKQLKDRKKTPFPFMLEQLNSLAKLNVA